MQNDYIITYFEAQKLQKLYRKVIPKNKTFESFLTRFWYSEC